jgi:hypothetical protein
MIQISQLKVNQSFFMLICLDSHCHHLFCDPVVVMQEKLCEENWVVIKIFVNIKQLNTSHATLVQVVAWLACQIGLFSVGTLVIRMIPAATASRTLW